MNRRVFQSFFFRALVFLFGGVASTQAQDPSNPGLSVSFRLKLPASAVFQCALPSGSTGPALAGADAFHFVSGAQALGEGDWMAATLEAASEATYYFGTRVVLQIRPNASLERLTVPYEVVLDRMIRSDLFVLQASSAANALRLASTWAQDDEVIAAYPVYSRQADLNFAFAPAPTDDFFPAEFSGVIGQWYLEDRDPQNATRLGVDVNARSAWTSTLGAGVKVAIADSGMEVKHLDLVDRTRGQPHFNFLLHTQDGSPSARFGDIAAHGTSCAGLIGATANNRIGMSGVAPESGLVSWVIVDRFGKTASDEALMEMFESELQTVAVQNHSWGVVGKTLQGPGVLELAALDKAWKEGRGGKGIVMVRAAGNGRGGGQDANENGYANDPRVIAVGAVQRNGRATAYSAPGACLLVSAPGGTAEEGGLFCTDLSGSDGANPFSFLPPFEYLSGFRWGSVGFIGTSASAPIVSGVVALMLSANPSLSVRDVQEILLLSAHPFDRSDPDLQPNGAGLLSSHNTGYGVVDAGEAVRLSLRWSNRPPAVTFTQEVAHLQLPIPDDGLRLEVSGESVPDSLKSIHTLPGTGPFADSPTLSVPWIFVPDPTNADSFVSLTNAAALMEWTPGGVVSEIENAAQHGAAFAVVFNCTTDGTTPCALGNGPPLNGTEYTSIPAVFIGRSSGLALMQVAQTNAAARMRIHLQTAEVHFSVAQTLSLEHVQVRVRTDHPLRGDLRITLVSPSGTKSVLQKLNDDTTPGPVDWTYTSTRHFFESSHGDWVVSFSDLAPDNAGSVLECGLILSGVELEDVDFDGLDDRWERAYFGHLNQGPRDVLSADGYSLIRKFAAGWNPLIEAYPLAMEVTPWNPQFFRLSWPGAERPYSLFSSENLETWGDPFEVFGEFPETSIYVDRLQAKQFFRLQLP